MKQQVYFFEIEEASKGTMNDDASNTHGIEEVHAGTESSNADMHSKLLKFL